MLTLLGNTSYIYIALLMVFAYLFNQQLSHSLQDFGETIVINRL